MRRPSWEVALEKIVAFAAEYWQVYGLRIARSALAILLIVVLAKLAQALAARVTRRILTRHRAGRDRALAERRAQTLLPLLLEVERYTIYFLAFATILTQLGIDAAAIFASVGVAGIALGFGAQNLVKDVISGSFLLFDGLIAVGDVVKIDNDTAGSVEAVGLRNTQLRDFSGLLWIVPNGDIRRFGNFNRGWTRAIVPVELTWEADLPQAREAILEVARQWTEENPDLVLEPPEVQSLMTLGQTGLSLRLVIKVQAMAHWAAERTLRERIKLALDARGIEAPYPRRVVVEPTSARAAGGD